MDRFMVALLIYFLNPPAVRAHRLVHVMASGVLDQLGCLPLFCILMVIRPVVTLRWGRPRRHLVRLVRIVRRLGRVV
jgi:hypothetical protein